MIFLTGFATAVLNWLFHRISASLSLSPWLVWLLSLVLAVGVSYAVLWLAPALAPRERALVRGLVFPSSPHRILAAFLAVLGGWILWIQRSHVPWAVPPDVLLPLVVASILNALGVEYLPRGVSSPPKENASGLPSPAFTPRVPGQPPAPRPDAPSVIRKVFQWESQGKSLEISLSIRRSVYQHFKKAVPPDPEGNRHVAHERWGEVFVVQGLCPEVYELVAQLTRALGFTERSIEEVQGVMDFVQQCIRYEHDTGADGSSRVEYPRFPIETLVEEAGDCEDVAILGAAILRVMGYSVALLFMPGHVALGIEGYNLGGTSLAHKGKTYYFAELTSNGWTIGEIPPDVDPESIQVVPIPWKTVEAWDTTKEG